MHEVGARNALQLLDPQTLAGLVRFDARIRAGEMADHPLPGFIDACHQQRPMGMEQVYAVALINSLVLSGDLTVTAFEMPHGAPRDVEVERANAALSCVPEIEAVFRGGYGDQDGYIKLRVDLVGNRFVNHGDIGECSMPAGSKFALEVGATSASRSYFHLVETGGLARWPYRDNLLHLWLLSPAKRRELFGA